MEKPARKPACPNFSSGPCAKRPGWTVDVLKDALVGRSHRSKEGKARAAVGSGDGEAEGALAVAGTAQLAGDQSVECSIYATV